MRLLPVLASFALAASMGCNPSYALPCPPGFEVMFGECHCPPALTQCGDTCVRLFDDERNCGACGNVCAAESTCGAGFCSCTADTPTRCGDSCVSLDDNNFHCGRCRNRCPAGAACEAGTCACGDPSQTPCGATCVDLSSNATNCGACGVACPLDTTCSAGACTCGGPTELVCDGACVDVRSDPMNCGVCGVSCEVGCSDGRCVGLAQLAVGGWATCVLVDGGSARCAGLALNDHLGAARGAPPRDIDVLPGIEELRVSFGHSCARVAGVVYCWGSNSNGQCGQGTTSSRATPRPVVGLPGPAIAIDVDDNSSCAIVEPGQVWCWGDANDGIGREGGPIAIATPTRWGSFDDAVEVDVGSRVTCVRRASGAVHCSSFIPRDPGSSERVEWRGATSLAVGDAFECAVLSGSVWCRGNNDYGQLGDGTTTGRSLPVRVQGLAGVPLQVAAGAHLACARVGSGQVYCWGRNDHGVTGGSSTRTTTALRIGGTTASRDLQCGLEHCCVRLGDDDVSCWGSGEDGRLGSVRGDTSSAVDFPY